MKNFYITTTLPYINAPIHLGHATEIVRADAIARYKKLKGFEVFFNTGTDEHGMKIYESAEKAGEEIQVFVDRYAALYRDTTAKLGVVSDVHYVRTTDKHHIDAAQEFWRRCDAKGYIYKKYYEAKYCIGCEEIKTDSELVDGKCPEHDRIPEIIKEENYFFKLSAFGDRLLELYNKNPKLIIPETRMNEMKSFVKSGLRDFSVSRPKEKVRWGIEVPGDPTHVMYVWFDALTNYISTLGWPDEGGMFERFWINGTPVQFCGKSNTRFQGVMWQAMLMAVDLPAPNNIIIDGFILDEAGKPMSKTLGNVISPLDLQEEYGTEALRYFILREFHPFEDTGVSKKSLKEAYNAHLANGIGNLTSRILKMAQTNLPGPVSIPDKNRVWSEDYKSALEEFNIKKAIDDVFEKIKSLDEEIQTKEPFKLMKTDPEKAKQIITNLVVCLHGVAQHLEPFMPETSRKIIESIRANKMPEAPLFLRKD